ncbi:hypothetical protein QEG98_21840 [Myxococcus sp. MxC21-1]|uniref:hypothetical protein n=1 Tax=Myxococcus sp. MxC21-1 TaxID=3041439 RepID=UPI0029308560|nr:hypothetical protein [Myxococcus sp. MxC21-1]WNZ58790.1 hypothetical protein QEG98_21840 [Myxococcus sp. MxC21-1]
MNRKTAAGSDFGLLFWILDARDVCVAACHKDRFVAGLDDSFSLTETPGVM